MGSKKVPLTLNESKTLPTIKLKSNPVELFKDHTLQLESLILNKNEFTNIKISPLSNKTHYNPNLNIFESRSEEHTSELESRPHLVCRLLLEKKKKKHSYS